MRPLTFLIFVSLLLASCSTQAPSITSTALTTTLPPTNTPIPTPTVTLTPSPMPTNKPTQTATPTITPLPSPTPTPKGFYVSDLGYAFVLPPNWSFDREEDPWLIFENPTYPLNLWITYGPYSEAEPCNMETWEKTLRTQISGMKTEESGEVKLGDGSPLARVLMKKTDHFTEIGMFTRGQKCFVMVTFGTNLGIESARKAMDAMYASMDLNSGWLYGVNRSDGLVLLGRLSGEEPEALEMDPAVTDRGAGGYTGLLYSGLVRLSPQLQIEPDLAESWKVSDDGKVYTFTLKEGLTFADGKPITAQDFKDSWERAADPETKSTTARTYLGDILGVKDKLDGKAEEISGVRAIDERTLEVKLEAPVTYFLAKLTYPTSFVVDVDQTETEKWFLEPNASGPFGLRQFKKGQALTFERNEAYHTPSTLGYVIYLLNWMGEPTNYYEVGDIDMSSVADSQVEEVKDPKNPMSKQLHEVTQMCTSFIALDNTKPPLDDPNVRKALSLAVDKERLIEVLTEGQGARADTILPPGMPGFSSDFKPQPFDTTLAKEALAASKYGKSVPSITLLAPGFSGQKVPFIDALVEMWQKNLGIRVSVKYIDPKEYTKSVRTLKGQLAFHGWCADYPDPQNFLDVLFHSQSEFNYANYTNTEVDQLLEKAKVELDPEARLALYHQIESALLQDYAAIPINHDVMHRLISPRIQGWEDTPIEVPIFHWLSLKPLEE